MIYIINQLKCLMQQGLMSLIKRGKGKSERKSKRGKLLLVSPLDHNMHHQKVTLVKVQ